MTGKHHFKKARMNMSKHQKGKNNGMFGRHHTEKTKQILRDKIILNPTNLKRCRELGKSRKGVILTKTHRNNISKSLTNIVRTEQYKTNMSNVLKQKYYMERLSKILVLFLVLKLYDFK